MAGRLALVGSGEYLPVLADVEDWLFADNARVYVQLATAAAPEGDKSLAHWHDLGRQAAERLGAEQVVIDIRTREDAMDPVYKDLKGRLKEAAGALTGNDKLRAEGAADQAEAQVEDLAGAVTDKASELTDQAAEKATGYWNEIKQAFDEGKKGE